MIVPAIVGALALAGAAGRWYRRSLARSILTRYQRSSSGIIIGAEPIEKRGSNGAAVLLIHGGGDTPQTMHHVADAFAAKGYSVSAPLLPGHGRDLDAFNRHDAEDWYAAASTELSRLRSTHEWVGVVGLSMGGAISARLAAETRSVDALVLASPYLSMPVIGSLMARSAAAWGLVAPAVGTASNRSVLDPDARAVSLGYGAFTARSLRALRDTAVRGFDSLSRITAPTLVIQSTTDNRIRSEATERAFSRLGSAEKRLEWIEGAGHVITVDFGWQGVVQRMVDWMESHRNAAKPGRGVAPVSKSV